MEHEDIVSDMDKVNRENVINRLDSDVADIKDDGIAENKYNDTNFLFPSLISNSEQFVFTVFVYKKLGFPPIGHDYLRSF